MAQGACRPRPSSALQGGTPAPAVAASVWLTGSEPGILPRMVMRSSPARWVVDPEDPRAPPTEIWEAMSEAERRAVVDALPSEFEPSETSPPESDFHDEEGSRLKRGLTRFYAKGPRDVHIAGDLTVYYPGEPMFAPDRAATSFMSPPLAFHQPVPLASALLPCKPSAVAKMAALSARASSPL